MVTPTPVTTLIPTPVDADIEQAVCVYPDGLLWDLAQRSKPLGGGSPLAIKYIPAKFADTYRGSGGRLKISTSPGFTWGDGTYVAPLAYPVSSAIFGRVGVVSQFDPTGWRVFDATMTPNQDLYLQWARSQGFGRLAALTALTPHYSQLLRNLFRETYRIDCVLFPPDQHNLAYTRPDDVWMNVTDWKSPGKIDSGPDKGHGGWSARFFDPWVAVLVDEEFEDELGGTVRKALLGVTVGAINNAATARAIAQIYAARHGATQSFVRIGA